MLPYLANRINYLNPLANATHLARGTRDFSIDQSSAAIDIDGGCQAATFKVGCLSADNTKRSDESAHNGIFRSFIMRYIYFIFANAVEVAICVIGAACMIYAASIIG